MAVLVDKEKVSGVVEILACEFAGTEFELDLVIALDLGGSAARPEIHSNLPRTNRQLEHLRRRHLSGWFDQLPVQPSCMDVDCARAWVANATRPIKAISRTIFILLLMRPSCFISPISLCIIHRMPFDVGLW